MRHIFDALSGCRVSVQSLPRSNGTGPLLYFVYNQRSLCSQYRRCTGTARSFYRHCTGAARSFYRHCTGTVQALHGHCTGTARALHSQSMSFRLFMPMRLFYICSTQAQAVGCLGCDDHCLRRVPDTPCRLQRPRRGHLVERIPLP